MKTKEPIVTTNSVAGPWLPGDSQGSHAPDSFDGVEFDLADYEGSLHRPHALRREFHEVRSNRLLPVPECEVALVEETPRRIL